MVEDPDLVMLPVANGVPAVGRTRMFCHVSLHGLPPELLPVIVTVRFVVVTVTAMVAPLVSPLIFLLAVAPPFINTVGAGALVAKMNPAGQFSTISPVPTSPPLAEGSWYAGQVRVAPPLVFVDKSAEIASPPVACVTGELVTVCVRFVELLLKLPSPLYAAVTV